MNNYQTIIAPKVEDLIQNNHQLVKKNSMASSWTSSINH